MVHLRIVLRMAMWQRQIATWKRVEYPKVRSFIQKTAGFWTIVVLAGSVGGSILYFQAIFARARS